MVHASFYCSKRVKVQPRLNLTTCSIELYVHVYSRGTHNSLPTPHFIRSAYVVARPGKSLACARFPRVSNPVSGSLLCNDRFDRKCATFVLHILLCFCVSCEHVLFSNSAKERLAHAMYPPTYLVAYNEDVQPLLKSEPMPPSRLK